MSPVPSERMMGKQPTVAERLQAQAARVVTLKIAPGSFAIGYIIAFGTILVGKALGF